MEGRPRRSNGAAREDFSLRHFGKRCDAMLIKVTPDKELRKRYKGRGGRDLPNAPKDLEELGERYQLLLYYLDLHGVRKEDRCFRPASYFPHPSEKQVLYVYVPNDNRAIAQLAQQCRREYGLHAYREDIGRELPPEIIDVTKQVAEQRHYIQKSEEFPGMK